MSNQNTIKTYASNVAAVENGRKAAEWLKANGIAGCRAVAAAFDGALPVNGRPTAEVQAVMEEIKPLYVAAGLKAAGVTTRIKRDRWIAAMAVAAGDDFIAASDSYDRLNSIVTQDNGPSLAAAIVAGKATIKATEAAIKRAREEKKKQTAPVVVTDPETAPVVEETAPVVETSTTDPAVIDTVIETGETGETDTREARPETAPAARVALETMTDEDLLAAWALMAGVVAARIDDDASSQAFVVEADRAAGNVRARAHARNKRARAAAAGK